VATTSMTGSATGGSGAFASKVLGVLDPWFFWALETRTLGTLAED